MQNEPAIQELLSKTLNCSVRSFKADPIGGGSINGTFKITVNSNLSVFCKINSAQDFPQLFQKEKNGLQYLDSQDIIRVPKVLALDELGDQQILILEWIVPGLIGEKFWSRFGEQIAHLHQISNPFFGCTEDNYMGALHQSNQPVTNWVDFLIHNRLEPQLNLALRNHLLQPVHIIQFNHLYKQLNGIFPDQAPSLLHGDLWSGNFLCNELGEPVLIDPAVYFGHPSVDMGMTGLFGGFDSLFYTAYRNQSPFAPNYLEQWNISRLYPLLIHLNLFGSSYLPPILQIIKGY
jgi:protein-ribulosamine 3-kinase